MPSATTRILVLSLLHHAATLGALLAAVGQSFAALDGAGADAGGWETAFAVLSCPLARPMLVLWPSLKTVVPGAGYGLYVLNSLFWGTVGPGIWVHGRALRSTDAPSSSARP